MLDILAGVIIGVLVFLIALTLGIILAPGIIIVALGVLITLIGLGIVAFVFVTFMVFFEIFLKMNSMPRVWIARKSSGVEDYLSKNKTGTSKTLDNASSFNFYNPKKFFWVWRVKQITGEDWRLKRISLMKASIGVNIGDLLKSGLNIDEGRYPTLAKTQKVQKDK